MHQQFLLLSLWAVATFALPLNINLGAYSPALVVGDGEISFGGKQDVSNLMNALEGAAVSGAAANGAAGAAPAAASIPAPAPAVSSAVPGATNIIADQSTPQIASLQGMGKEIAPRIVKLEEMNPTKRDINGFNAALKFAADAIKNTPKIQLGTEAAGVGILQDAGISAAQPATRPTTAAASAAREVLARDEGIAGKTRTTVTTMFVQGGLAPAQVALQEQNVVDPEVGKRTPSLGLGGVNLNIAEGQVAGLTFVETRAVGDDE